MQLSNTVFVVVTFVAAIVTIFATFHAGRKHYNYAGPFAQSHSLVRTADSQWKKDLALKLDSLILEHATLSSEWDLFKNLEWIYDIGIYDYYHEYSQTHADSIIQFIFQNLGTTDKYYVEFGTEDGSQTNTRWLREKQGWTGLLMDGGFDNSAINLHKEMMTKSNIMDLFKKYSVPKEFDLLSVDLDYNTYWVFKAISHKVYRPRVLIVEYTAGWSWSVDAPMISTADCETCMWDFTEYQGASAQAINKLARDKGYTLVYIERMIVNMYFIRTDLLGGQEVADKMFPFKRMFRWSGNGIKFPKSDKVPVTVNGLDD